LGGGHTNPLGAALVVGQHAVDRVAILRRSARVDADGARRIGLPGAVTVVEARVRRAVAEPALEDLRAARELGLVAEVAAMAARLAPACVPQLLGRSSCVERSVSPSRFSLRQVLSHERNAVSSAEGSPTRSAAST
jgi:hypothetical protein